MVSQTEIPPTSEASDALKIWQSCSMPEVAWWVVKQEMDRRKMASAANH